MTHELKAAEKSIDEFPSSVTAQPLDPVAQCVQG